MIKRIISALLAVVGLVCFNGCHALDALVDSVNSHYAESVLMDVFKENPRYINTPYVTVNNNKPTFSSTELQINPHESYSPLDKLGRCGVAFACLGQELMPTQERTEINQVRPSGWHSVTYDIVDGKYLYNRCHLIGYQLTGENINERNLITGTRYMNTLTMMPFENMVADYIKETGNHVAYRVTPVFDGNNLLARGVQIEAMSIEDSGYGVSFNIYCFNVQPGVEIDYATGESRLVEDESIPSGTPSHSVSNLIYVLNTKTKLYHRPGCEHINAQSTDDKRSFAGTTDRLKELGYKPCDQCRP